MVLVGPFVYFYGTCLGPLRKPYVNTIHKNIQKLYTHKKRELSFALFDCLRFWTTLLIQIYARKTHAGNASVHKPYLNT